MRGRSPRRGGPDPLSFLNPWDQGPLIRYLASLRQLHATLPLPWGPRGELSPLPELLVPPRLRQEEGPATDLLDALDQSRHMVVLGEPGSGRTTLLSHLAHCLTDPVRNPVIDRLGRMVPLCLDLRELAGERRPRRREDLLGALERLPGWSAELGALLPRLAQKGQLIYLIDGYDELEPELRAAWRDCLLDTMSVDEGCTWVVVARALTYARLPLREEAVVEGLPPSLAALAQRESQGLEPALWQLCPWEALQIRAYIDRSEVLEGGDPAGRGPRALLGALEGSELASAWARRPALLALMVLAWRADGHLEGPDRLPGQVARAGLRQLSALGLPEGRARAWLGALAREPGLELSAAQAELARHWPGQSGLDQRLVRWSAHTGLLCREGARLRVLEPELQQHLAAEDLAQALEQGEGLSRGAAMLRAWARQPQGRAAVARALHQLNERPGHAEKVLRAVLGTGRRHTLGELEELGPLAVELARHPELPERARAAAQKVWIEGVQRWALERGRLPTWAPDLAPLAGLSQLSALDASGNDQLSQLGPLSQLRKLQRLDLHGCAQIRDLAPLAGLGLQWLDLRADEAISDPAPLGRLPDLRWLDLGGCTGISDLRPLARLTNLQALALHGCSGITDLSPLAALRSLRALVISDCAGIWDLGPLRRLPSGGQVWVKGSGVRLVPPELQWQVIGLAGDGVG